jgi:metal transporter CNNM
MNTEWWRIIVAILLIFLSGLFAGLTLGLMSLDLVDLHLALESENEEEAKCAKRIYPVRKKGNLLLCTLLIGNTAVNSGLSILWADIVGGIVGFAVSTLSVLILGEIIPQSICHRYGLKVGYYTVPIVRVFIFLFFPLSYPTSKLLDWFLGQEPLHRYSKRQLKSLVKMQGPNLESVTEGNLHGLSSEETELLGSALEFAQKKVEEIMTPLERVFMLDENSHLNFKTLTLIFQSGHSRIPVYSGTRDNIIGILFTKDLVLIDPDDDISLKTVLSFFHREIQFVFHETTLDVMLKEFKSGRGHLAVIYKVNNEGPTDPFYQNIGIVTLEDVIEEIIGSEIVDETDVYPNNATEEKVWRKRKIDMEVLKMFDPGAHLEDHLSHNEILVVASYLCHNISAFSSSILSYDILIRMLKDCQVVEFHKDIEKTQGEDGDRVAHLVFKRGVPAVEAVLIIYGKLKITAGSEGFVSQVGPWTMLGIRALTDEIYAPDFTAEILEYPLRILKIHRRLYRQALKRSSSSSSSSSETELISNTTV